MAWEISPLDRWTAARRHPETYPGDRPPGSYVLLDDRVCPLLVDGASDPRVVTRANETEQLDAVLARAGLPVLADRVAILAYGGNRNPATLAIKLSNYGYRCPGARVALPVLRGAIAGADVAACDLSGQGYLFGDLLVDEPLVGRTRCEAWVALVDPDQLRVLHESEIGTDDYVGALFEGVCVEGRGALRGPVLGYAARRACFSSPLLGAPLAFDTVQADGRTLPELSPMRMLDHVLDAAGLRERAAAIAGAQAGPDLALALARHLNLNWWREFEGRRPEPGYLELLGVVRAWIAEHALARSTAAVMAERGLCLSREEVHHPDASLTWGRL